VKTHSFRPGKGKASTIPFGLPSEGKNEQRVLAREGRGGFTCSTRLLTKIRPLSHGRVCAVDDDTLLHLSKEKEGTLLLS